MGLYFLRFSVSNFERERATASERVPSACLDRRARERVSGDGESVLFIGTRFSNLYTAVVDLEYPD